MCTKQNNAFRSVVVSKEGYEMPSDVIWQEMCMLRSNMCQFICEKSSADSDMDWIYPMLEIITAINGETVSNYVSPQTYARVKGKPAMQPNDIEKWGDTADIMVLCKMLNMKIICVRKEKDNDIAATATIYHPADKSLKVSIVCSYLRL